MSDGSPTQRRVHGRSVPLRGAIAVVLAVVGNGALVTAISAVGIAPDFRALTLPPVVFLSAAGAAGAAAVYWLLGRYVADVDRTFVRVATAALIVSFVPDVALLAVDPAATVTGVLALMILHVVVAAAAVGVLVYWEREP